MGCLKGIVFDLDGTLIDSVWAHAISWVKAFEANGFSARVDEVEPLIGLGGRKIVERLLGENGLRSFSALTSYKNRVYLELVGKVELFPGVEETLFDLRAKDIKIALATSTVSEVLPKVLGKFGLERCFDSIVPGDKIAKGKPDPEIFLKAFEGIEVDPRLGAIVGDTEYDILPATKIGATSILVSHGRRSQLSIKPDYMIGELRNLLRVLEEHL